MTRKSYLACLLGAALVFISSALAQSSSSQQQNQGQPADKSHNDSPSAQQQPPEEENPPEEDETVKPKVYPFDPLESERNIKVGDFYMRKGEYRGAASRYDDATKYNPNSAEAFLKLGQAEQKLKNKDKAKAAFARVLRLAPDSKFAREAKKKLEGL